MIGTTWEHHHSLNALKRPRLKMMKIIKAIAASLQAHSRMAESSRMLSTPASQTFSVTRKTKQIRRTSGQSKNRRTPAYYGPQWYKNKGSQTRQRKTEKQRLYHQQHQIRKLSRAEPDTQRKSGYSRTTRKSSRSGKTTWLKQESSGASDLHWRLNSNRESALRYRLRRSLCRAGMLRQIGKVQMKLLSSGTATKQVLRHQSGDLWHLCSRVTRGNQIIAG